MQCTSLACPRLRNTDPNNRVMAINFSSSQSTRDCLGNTWCNYCEKQPALIAWGKKNNWPDIQATGLEARYRIGSGCWNWQTSITMSNQDAIDAYYAELIGANEASA